MMRETIQDGISQPLSLPRPIAIYGCGAVARDVLKALADVGHTVEWVIDYREPVAVGLETYGVQSPTSEQILRTARAKATVVIAAFNPHADVGEIRRRLLTDGWGHVVSFVQLYEWLPYAFGDRFWLAPRELLSEEEEAIASARSLWSDRSSLALFDACLDFRRCGDDDLLPQPDPTSQYRPVGIPLWKAPVRLIDGGAFDGDTLQLALEESTALEAYAGFEPDPQNFARLKNTLADVRRSGEDRVFPLGLWDREETLNFMASHSGSSSISSLGVSRIDCVALDRFLPEFRPSLLKLDIEGAEVRALLGARRTIEAHRPALAVCVYHRPTDLWQIPLMLHDWQLGYRFALRSHAFSTFDTVLYAVADHNE